MIDSFNNNMKVLLFLYEEQKKNSLLPVYISLKMICSATSLSTYKVRKIIQYLEKEELLKRSFDKSCICEATKYQLTKKGIFEVKNYETN